MTGPEHYREAERLLSAATELGDPKRGDYVALVTTAQVHATLAGAAAQALLTVGTWFEIESDAEEWCHAIQVRRKPDTEPDPVPSEDEDEE